MEETDSPLQKMHAWRAGAKTDAYMAGVTRADGRGEGRGRGCECGGIYVRRPIRGFRNEIPSCDRCGGFPRAFVVRIDLPGMPKKEFRFNRDGERLESPSAADELLVRIRKEVEARTINLMEYLPKKKKAELLFENFAETYISYRKNDVERPLTPKAERSIRTALDQYLAPTKATLKSRPHENGAPVGHPGFRGISVDQITTGMVKRFKLQWRPARMIRDEEGNLVPVAKTTRPRDVALEVLHAILNYAYELEYIQVMPRFGEKKRSNESTKRVPIDVQEAILARVPDPWRAAMEAMRILLCRHSDIRAQRRKHLDRDRGVVRMIEHYSGNELRPGRKSDSREHLAPVGPEYWAIVDRLKVRNLDPDAFVFSVDGKTPLSENSFNVEWRKAQAAYNEEHGTDWDVDSYRGIKSSTWSHAEEQGISRDVLARRAGETTTMGKRYGSRSAESTRGVLEGVILKMKRPEPAPKEAT